VKDNNTTSEQYELTFVLCPAELSKGHFLLHYKQTHLQIHTCSFKLSTSFHFFLIHSLHSNSTVSFFLYDFTPANLSV